MTTCCVYIYIYISRTIRSLNYIYNNFCRRNYNIYIYIYIYNNYIYKESTANKQNGISTKWRLYGYRGETTNLRIFQHPSWSLLIHGGAKPSTSYQRPPAECFLQYGLAFLAKKLCPSRFTWHVEQLKHSECQFWFKASTQRSPGSMGNWQP